MYRLVLTPYEQRAEEVLAALRASELVYPHLEVDVSDGQIVVVMRGDDIARLIDSVQGATFSIQPVGSSRRAARHESESD